MESALNFFEKIKYKWEKTTGLLLVMLSFLFLYFSFIADRLNELIKIELWVLYLLIPFLILMIIFAYWLINTNRVDWLKSKKITVGIIIKIDEDESEVKFKNLIKDTIDDINSEFKNIKLRLYPINHISSKNSLIDFLKRKSHVVDSIIYAEVNSGKGKNMESGEIEDIIEIIEINYCGNFYNGSDLKFFKTSINIGNEVQLRNINKNWAYIESNSKNDKIKIKNNLEDSILFYCGIYLIYQNNFEDSLPILKKLHNPNLSKATINFQSKTISANKDFLSASRLNEILLNLYTMNASRAYTIENNKAKAYKALKECEQIFGKHPQSFNHAIGLARLTYEQNNNIEEAKHYTNIAKAIKPFSTEVFLNLGYFALIENKPDELALNYKQLIYAYKHKNYNFIDTIHFLEREKKNYKELHLTFEFCISILNFLYGDKNLGRLSLIKLKNINFNNDKSYENLNKLIELLLKKGSIKSPYYKKYNNKKKGKTRRKK